MYLKELLDIQSELNAPKIHKNSFGNYMYRKCEDIMQAVKPLLLKYNSQIVVNDTIECHGKRYYIKATATFICESGTISCSAYARESLIKKGMDEAQITGMSSSYARKYALNGLLLIDDERDSDEINDNNDKSKKQKNIQSNKIQDSHEKQQIKKVTDNFKNKYKLCENEQMLKELWDNCWPILTKYKDKPEVQKEMTLIKSLAKTKKELLLAQLDINKQNEILEDTENGI